MNEGITDSLPTDPSLLRRMGSVDDSEAWTEFASRYRHFIRGLAWKHGMPEDDAKDLEQVVLLGLVHTIVGFKPRRRRGSFRTWLARRIRWRIGDMMRSARTHREEPLFSENGDGDPPLPGLIDEAADVAERIKREERVAMVRLALNTLSPRINPRSIQAFELVFLQQEPSENVARLLKMNRATLYVACHRVEKALRKRLVELLELDDHGEP